MAADFIDLKSPYRSGHSRRCADLAADADVTEQILRRAPGLDALNPIAAAHQLVVAGPVRLLVRLAARGLSTKQIADQLFISPKTADHHIQHVSTKIGVSTRAAAALWAMQNVVLG